MKSVIETKRLILREMTANDFSALYAVLADSDIMKHYPYIFDENRVRNWIKVNIDRYRIFGFGLWMNIKMSKMNSYVFMVLRKRTCKKHFNER